jgi:hypothetical protein
MVSLFRNVCSLNDIRPCKLSRRLVLIKLVNEAYIAYVENTICSRQPHSIDVRGIISKKEFLKCVAFEFVSS